MRRDCTPIWVDDGGRHRPLERVRLTDRGAYTESFLQETLHACPELLPVEELDADFFPLVSLGREIDAIDNLFISPSGKLTLVETKLWRNPEATRTVVAQVLAYATRLSGWSYEQLERSCRDALSPAPLGDTSLYELVRARFPELTPSACAFHDAVQRSLTTGRFLLLIVGDGIREGLEVLLTALHSHPRLLFTFGLVEMQIYRDPESASGHLIVPHVLANSVEIVRAVVRVCTSGPAEVSVELEDTDQEGEERRSRRRLSKEEFFEEIADPASAAVVRRLLSRARELGAIIQPRSNSVSVRLQDPGGTKQRLTLFVVTTTGDLYTGWLAEQLERIGADPVIARAWVQRIASLVPGVGSSTSAPDMLSRNVGVNEIEPVLDDFLEALAETIEAIEESVG